MNSHIWRQTVCNHVPEELDVYLYKDLLCSGLPLSLFFINYSSSLRSINFFSKYLTSSNVSFSLTCTFFFFFSKHRSAYRNSKDTQNHRHCGSCQCDMTNLSPFSVSRVYMSLTAMWQQFLCFSRFQFVTNTTFIGIWREIFPPTNRPAVCLINSNQTYTEQAPHDVIQTWLCFPPASIQYTSVHSKL